MGTIDYTVAQFDHFHVKAAYKGPPPSPSPGPTPPGPAPGPAPSPAPANPTAPAKVRKPHLSLTQASPKPHLIITQAHPNLTHPSPNLVNSASRPRLDSQ
jgi:hypothetical protein